MRTIWFGHVAVDEEEDGIYIYETELIAGVRQRIPGHYCRVLPEEVPQLILALKEIWGSRSAIIGTKK